ncbi:Hypothetical_protein [Hexamita inflata]|uniref:Hypothetical_protein n=1 Tax=Hexamita inflata TaxID=28002 RepID=A0AA86V0G1_9EUKA|nr:Hypothetical protein HINF_LOCUS59266 [Hexamita inflata]
MQRFASELAKLFLNKKRGTFFENGMRGQMKTQTKIFKSLKQFKRWTDIDRYALFTSTVPILLHLIIFYRNTFTSFIFIRSCKSIVKHIYFLHNPFFSFGVLIFNIYYKSQTHLYTHI